MGCPLHPRLSGVPVTETFEPPTATPPSATPPDSMPPVAQPSAAPTARELRRWRQYLADERTEAAVYQELAQRHEGPEADILRELALAEQRHQQHWKDLLGDRVGPPQLGSLRTRMLVFFARHFGFVFVLALAQRAEARSPYDADDDATDQMAADERIHGEVLRGLATKGRERISGSFRAAVFGANDGLVSNLALVLGVGAAGIDAKAVLFTGIAGLLAGALSMGAGEYVSVRSQRELLASTRVDPATQAVLADLDVNANELSLVFRARGMSPVEADAHAARVLAATELSTGLVAVVDEHEEIGSPWRVAVSSFAFFASGALVPVLPYLFGLTGIPAIVLSAVLVGVALLGTGGMVGVLSGASPLRRALRQLGIGYGAAAVTYLLGLAFHASGI